MNQNVSKACGKTLHFLTLCIGLTLTAANAARANCPVPGPQGLECSGPNNCHQTVYIYTCTGWGAPQYTCGGGCLGGGDDILVTCCTFTVSYPPPVTFLTLLQ